MPVLPIRPAYAILALAAVVCALAVLAAVLWMGSRSDLDAVEARGTAIGVPATWTAAGVAPSSRPVLSDWQRLHQLAAANLAYADSPGVLGSPLRACLPPPPELARHHAGLPAAALAEIDDLCAGLRPDAVTTNLDVDMLSPMPLLSEGRHLSRLMQERTALADPPAAQRLLGLHLAAITAEHPRTLIGALVAFSRLALWQTSAIGRLRDPGLDRSALADQADATRRWLAAGMDSAWCGEYRFMRTTAEQIAAGDPRYATGLLPQFDLPNWLDGHGLHRPLVRLVRRDLLELSLDNIAAWRSAPDAAGRLAALRAIEARVAGMPRWTPSGRALQTLAPATATVCGAWAKADAGLALLAAELRGTAWPQDPTDPAGGPIRRIERDGRLIGYYLLGRNGADDGGRPDKDLCTALYEPLGKTRAADPWQAEPPPTTPPEGAFIYGAP